MGETKSRRRAPGMSPEERRAMIIAAAVLFSVGLAMPNTPALALARHGEAAGTASALLGAIQMGTGAVVSPVVGVLGNNAVAMGTVMAGGAALALVVLLVVVRPWRLADLES